MRTKQFVIFLCQARLSSSTKPTFKPFEFVFELSGKREDIVCEVKQTMLRDLKPAVSRITADLEIKERNMHLGPFPFSSTAT
jgi:hypothetical protein